MPVTASYFYPSLIFEGKAGVFPSGASCENLIQGQASALPANIILRWEVNGSDKHSDLFRYGVT